MMEESKEEIKRNFMSLSIIEKDIDSLIDVYTYSHPEDSKIISDLWKKQNNFDNNEIELVNYLINYKINRATFEFKKTNPNKWGKTIKTLISISQDFNYNFDFPKFELPDNRFVIDRKKLFEAEKWAVTNKYIDKIEGKWLRGLGQCACYLSILQAQSIIAKPNRKIVRKIEIDGYFSNRYKLNSLLGENFKIKVSNKFTEDFRTLIFLLAKVN